MNKVALVVSTHNGTKKLNQIARWITSQLPWDGILVVVASGNTDFSTLSDVCSSYNFDFVFRNFVNCVHAKRNLRAEIAFNSGAKYVTFLNDYQHLSRMALHGFELEQHNEDIVFGNIEFDKTKGVTSPRISSLNVPLSRNSSKRDTWGIFSSVSEAGMLIDLKIFRKLGGWQYPTIREKSFIGGDGMLLAARVFIERGTFGYSRNYIVLGGHQNKEIDKDSARGRAAVYPYAFTLSTKIAGVPKWVAIRFIGGRILRIFQTCLMMDYKELKMSAFEISSRLRGYFGIKPAKYSKLLDETLEFNCRTSQYYCAKNGARNCH